MYQYRVSYRRSATSSRKYHVVVVARNPDEARIKAQLADPWYVSSVEVKRLGEFVEAVMEAPRG